MNVTDNEIENEKTDGGGNVLLVCLLLLTHAAAAFAGWAVGVEQMSAFVKELVK